MASRSPTRKSPARKVARTVRKAKSPVKATTPVRKAWLAGVDAATNARTMAGEAVGKVMKQANKLVKEGKALQAEGQRAALHRAQEARAMAVARAEEARTRATKAVSHIERVFEQRVSKVLGKFGVPSSESVKVLTRRVAELQANVDQLRRSRARA